MQHARRGPGFTFIELLMVVAILGILALAAIPSLSSSDPYKLDRGASEIAGALRFARAEALRSGLHHGVRLDTDGRRVRVFWLDLATHPPTERFTVQHPVEHRPYDFDPSGASQAGGVQVTGAFRYHEAGTPAWAVAFDPRGEPVSPEDLDPLLSGAATLALGEARRTVQVAPLTGRVSVQ